MNKTEDRKLHFLKKKKKWWFQLEGEQDTVVAKYAQQNMSSKPQQNQSLGVLEYFKEDEEGHFEKADVAWSGQGWTSSK